MTRRTLVSDAARLFLVVVGAVYVIGCGGPTAPSNVADVASTSTVVNGHSHTINIPSSDQTHPANMTYTSSTDSGHNHTVTLTANQLATIASGGSVTVTSSASTVTGNHTHDFTFQGKK